MNNRKFILNAGVLVSFIVILLFIYSPAVQINYEYMEDYDFINSYRKFSFFGEIENWSGSGLVGYGIFTYAVQAYATSATSVRLFSIIGLGLLAYLIYTILTKYRVKSEHAFLISILICTLPSFQIIVAWLSTAPNIPSAILSVIACLLSLKAVSKKITGRSIPLFLITVFLLVTAIHIYQPSAMFYWAISVIPLALLKDEDLSEKWYIPFGIHTAVGLISTAVYFFSVKVLHYVLNIGFVGRGSLVELKNIPLKLKWFFFCPLNYALNLWNFFPTYTLAGIVGAVIIWFFVSKFLSALRKEQRRVLLWNHSLRLFFITGMLFLCYLPILVITDTVPSIRTLASLVTAICFLFYFGSANVLDSLQCIPGFSSSLKDKAVIILLTIVSLFTAYHAHSNVNDFAMLHANEFKYVKNAISAEYKISQLSGITEIYLKRPDRNKAVESGFLYAEFGLPTSGFAGYGPPTVIRKALFELGLFDLRHKIRFTEGAPDAPPPKGKNVLVIDMTKFDYLNYNSSITKPQRYCITIPTRL